MTKSRFLMFLCAALVAISVCSVEASVLEGPTCIVIPTRPTLVQFSFDLLRLRRQMYLVAQDKEIGGDATVLHVWDDATQDWIRIGVEEFVAGTVFTQTPRRLIVVGGEADVPEELAAAPSWTEEAYQIESLDLVTVLNKFQIIFKFNEREWKWLAKRYGITFEDLNAERRRYGRYGKPGEDKNQVMPGEVIEEPMETVPEGPIEIITAPEPELEETEAPAEVVEEVKEEVKDTPPEDK
jgi:hypothetical protein